MRRVVVKHSHDLSAGYAARVIMVNVFDPSRHCPLHARPMLHRQKNPDPVTF